ncbi:MAG TPA: hypothetical protein PJ982_00900 [Lacipirellulaceae bacterium]|nr:hypothetical protein [Lacipirellulaceae bacterium]
MCAAEVRFVTQRLLTPLQLSVGRIEVLTEARAQVEVEVGSQGARGIGRGSIYLSDLWSWPGAAIDHDERDAILRDLCEQCALEFPRMAPDELLHPTELGLRLHEHACHGLEVREDPPALARAMCSSPLDAAIHDAVGQAVGVSAFRFYDEPADIPAADAMFPQVGGTAAAVRRALQIPRTTLPAWYLIGKDDDVAKTVCAAREKIGCFCFKLKISGVDARLDAERTAEVFTAALNAGVDRPRITVDSNEANPDVASVMEYLDILQGIDIDAYGALEYLEQPTSRDIIQNAFDWRPVSDRKPVFLDEGLTDLSILEAARQQGWSGLALKTCKGHSMLMASAAWGVAHGMPLALQDLTNPGVSLIHAALVGAYLPTVNGVELNSPQYTPDANHDFLPRLSQLFEPREGFHRLPSLTANGLGSKL